MEIPLTDCTVRTAVIGVDELRFCGIRGTVIEIESIESVIVLRIKIKIIFARMIGTDYDLRAGQIGVI